MTANFLLKCWFEPVGPERALAPSWGRGPFGVSLLLQVPFTAPYPKGFDIDGRVEFDMHEDCGVERIEFHQRLGGGLNHGHVRPRMGETYFRLFVEPGERSKGNPNSHFTLERVGTMAHAKFTDGKIESRYLLGPGVTALAGSGKLRGIDIDLSGFMD